MDKIKLCKDCEYCQGEDEACFVEGRKVPAFIKRVLLDCGRNAKYFKPKSDKANHYGSV